MLVPAGASRRAMCIDPGTYHDVCDISGGGKSWTQTRAQTTSSKATQRHTYRHYSLLACLPFPYKKARTPSFESSAIPHLQHPCTLSKDHLSFSLSVYSSDRFWDYHHSVIVVIIPSYVSFSCTTGQVHRRLPQREPIPTIEHDGS
jgi:hypothetical protein